MYLNGALLRPQSQLVGSDFQPGCQKQFSDMLSLINQAILLFEVVSGKQRKENVDTWGPGGDGQASLVCWWLLPHWAGF